MKDRQAFAIWDREYKLAIKSGFGFDDAVGRADRAMVAARRRAEQAKVEVAGELLDEAVTAKVQTVATLRWLTGGRTR